MKKHTENERLTKMPVPALKQLQQSVEAELERRGTEQATRELGEEKTWTKYIGYDRVFEGLDLVAAQELWEDTMVCAVLYEDGDLFEQCAWTTPLLSTGRTKENCWLKPTRAC